VTRRQNVPKVYRLNGAVYVTSRDIIMKENRVLGRDTAAHIMSPERSVDIDTELDFKLAELLMKETKQ
jgi:CMP-N,N'-diacetyllegionaminic acid synthase